MKRGIILGLTALTLGLGLFGCAHNPQIVSRTAVYSKKSIHEEAGIPPDVKAKLDKHCLFGIPKTLPASDFGPTEYVTKDGYVLLHSDRDKIPVWVSEHLNASQLTGPAVRRDNFFPEPSLQPGKRSERADYARSGFDQGHQAPAADFKSDQHLMDDSFSLANMSPQCPNLNRIIWSHLEDKFRGWIGTRGSGYIITGPIFYDPKEDDSTTADGVVDHAVIGHGVAVPTHFYKILMATNSTGKWESIAFVLPNIKTVQVEDWPHYLVSIDWIEDHTGLNFMPDLNAAEEKRLERTASPLW
jgi:endonuclease G